MLKLTSPPPPPLSASGRGWGRGLPFQGEVREGGQGLGLLQLHQLLLPIGFVERVQEFVQLALKDAI